MPYPDDYDQPQCLNNLNFYEPKLKIKNTLKVKFILGDGSVQQFQNCGYNNSRITLPHTLFKQ